MYENMRITNAAEAPTLQENAWLPLLLAYVLLVWGSAWAYCQATCGWGRVRRCDTGWIPPRVFVECR